MGTPVSLTIAANTYDYDIYGQAGSPAGVVDVTLTINAGIIVGQISAPAAIYQSSGFAGGSTVSIIIRGSVLGSGGFGGAGGQGYAPNFTTGGQVGGTGGYGIRLSQNTSIDVSAAQNLLGGGDGGYGGSGFADLLGAAGGGGGGGGAGYQGGAAGVGGPSNDTAGGSGSDGGISGAGAGGYGGSSFYGAGQDGDPGNGWNSAKGVNLNGFTLTYIADVTFSPPLATLALSALAPASMDMAGMRAPLATLTLTALPFQFQTNGMIAPLAVLTLRALTPDGMGVPPIVSTLFKGSFLDTPPANVS